MAGGSGNTSPYSPSSPDKFQNTVGQVKQPTSTHDNYNNQTVQDSANFDFGFKEKVRDSAINSTIQNPHTMDHYTGVSHIAGNPMASRVMENQPMYGQKLTTPTEIFGSNLGKSNDYVSNPTVYLKLIRVETTTPLCRTRIR